MFDVVVAYYGENIAWLKTLLAANPDKINRLFLYNKSSRGLIGTAFIDGFGVNIIQAKLPNVGREAETYLHHICQYYDDLAEHTLFIQGDPMDHLLDHSMILMPTSTYTSFYGTIIKEVHIVGNPHRRYGLFVAEKAQSLWPNTPNEREYAFSAGAQYIVHRDTIRNNPQAFYTNLREQMHNLHKLGHRQTTKETIDITIDAWLIERLWPLIFSAI